jgi:hypothetical protein
MGQTDICFVANRKETAWVSCSGRNPKQNIYCVSGYSLNVALMA